MIYYTTLEQSKKLVELGLDSNSADMVIVKDNTYYNALSAFNGVTLCQNYDEIKDKTNYIPCWSLGALMNLLPPSIQTGEGMQNQYEIDIRKYWGNEENLYQIAYGNNRGFGKKWHDMINTGEKENLTDAAFQMIWWLLENGYIKKGE